MGGSGSDLLEPLPIQTIISEHQHGLYLYMGKANKQYSTHAVLPNTLLIVLQH